MDIEKWSFVCYKSAQMPFVQFVELLQAAIANNNNSKKKQMEMVENVSACDLPIDCLNI